MTAPTDGERAAFEAGIKCGALYHQFAGTPVSPASAPGLAEAMAAAIENQPFCRGVEVDPHEDRIRRAIAGEDPLGSAPTADADDADEAGATATDAGGSDADGSSGGPDGSGPDADGAEAAATDEADYTELTGTLYDATVTVERAGTTARARLATEDGYPLFSLSAIDRD